MNKQDELKQDGIKWAHDEILLPVQVPGYIGIFAYSYLEALREIAGQLERIADAKILDEQAADYEPLATIGSDTRFELNTKVGDIISDGKRLCRIKSIGEHGRYVMIKQLNWYEAMIYRIKKFWNG